jgi:predicted class III extradiol MEMO1 family dioxygenase
MKNQDMLIQNLNELITAKKEELAQCEEELKNWDHSYIVRTALNHYKLELQDDIKRYDERLINALKKGKGIG